MGDDDKIYFFFSERAVEYDCYKEQVVARVARVCKSMVFESLSHLDINARNGIRPKRKVKKQVRDLVMVFKVVHISFLHPCPFLLDSDNWSAEIDFD
eukprot:g41054.t1